MKTVYGQLYYSGTGVVTLEYWHPHEKKMITKTYGGEILEATSDLEGGILEVLSELDDKEAWEVVGVTSKVYPTGRIRPVYHMSNDLYSIPEEREVKDGKKK